MPELPGVAPTVPHGPLHRGKAEPVPDDHLPRGSVWKQSRERTRDKQSLCGGRQKMEAQDNLQSVPVYRGFRTARFRLAALACIMEGTLASAKLVVRTNE